jgi:hypothetical protein
MKSLLVTGVDIAENVAQINAFFENLGRFGYLLKRREQITNVVDLLVVEQNKLVERGLLSKQLAF